MGFCWRMGSGLETDHGKHEGTSGDEDVWANTPLKISDLYCKYVCIGR